MCVSALTAAVLVELAAIGHSCDDVLRNLQPPTGILCLYRYMNLNPPAAPPPTPSLIPGNHQTHTTLRESARSCAERKARVLFKHRPAVIRWTAAGASSTPRQQQQDCTAGGSTTVAVAPPTARSDDSPQTVVAGEQRNGSRIQSDLVSPLLSLVHTESMGRHVVAQDGPLQAGTLLLRETPFAWSLHPEFSGEFCAHCLCEV